MSKLDLLKIAKTSLLCAAALQAPLALMEGAENRASLYAHASCGGKGKCGNVIADDTGDRPVLIEGESLSLKNGTLTETQFTAKLTPEHKALYQSLPAEGKALARQIGTQKEYSDPNVAVKEAAHRVKGK